MEPGGLDARLRRLRCEVVVTFVTECLTVGPAGGEEEEWCRPPLVSLASSAPLSGESGVACAVGESVILSTLCFNMFCGLNGSSEGDTCIGLGLIRLCVFECFGARFGEAGFSS